MPRLTSKSPVSLNDNLHSSFISLLITEMLNKHSAPSAPYLPESYSTESSHSDGLDL